VPSKPPAQRRLDETKALTAKAKQVTAGRLVAGEPAASDVAQILRLEIALGGIERAERLNEKLRDPELAARLRARGTRRPEDEVIEG
jgi:hypothetical protein